MTSPRLRPVQHEIMEIDGEERHVLTDPSGYVEHPIGLSLGAVILVQHFDGTRTLDEVRAHARASYGLEASAEAVLALADGLDAAGFLESPRFEALRGAANDAYRAAGTRPAKFAGESYPADPAALRAELDDRFTDVRRAQVGDRATPAGLVAPHIDLRVAENTYAAAYGAFARGAAPPDVFVVFGTAHAFISEPAVASSVPYDTPLGPVPVDRELLDAIAAGVSFDLYRDEAAHRAEHSVEFQAVHLRYLFGDSVPPMVAVLMGGPEGAAGGSAGAPADVAGAVRRAAVAMGRRVCYVAGADLAHIGPRFSDPDPVDDVVLADLERHDRTTLAAVECGDAAAFHASVTADGNARRICGLAPIHAVMRCTERAAVLDAYHQWVADGSVVSFAALTIPGS